MCLSWFRFCSVLPFGHLKGKSDLLALVCDVYCDLVTFPFGVLGQVWYLIVSIPNHCCLSYFAKISEVTQSGCTSIVMIPDVSPMQLPCSDIWL